MSGKSTSRKSPKGNRQRVKTVPFPHPQSSSSQGRSPLDSVAKNNRESLKMVSVDEYIKPKGSSQKKQSSLNPLSTIFWSLVRLLIFGVGLGAIAGTVLANIDVNQIDFSQLSVQLPFAKAKEQPANSQANSNQRDLKVNLSQLNSSSLSLNQDLVPLKQKFAKLAAKYPKLELGAFFVDLDNGAYANFDGDKTFSAASTIKIPILVAFFEDLDAGKIYLDEMLTMKPELIGGGSGSMQYQTPGKQFTALETASKMIVISDNTATNMLIERLGGADLLNQRFQKWGLKTTVINNWLPDLEGTNTTSPQDLSKLLARVNQGELISLRSRDRLLGIMRETQTKTLLPQGLEKDAIISHKTGDIGTVLGDAGIIDMPNGKRYIGAVMAKRPHNDPKGRTLIQETSRAAYQHFKWYQPRPFDPKISKQTSESGSDGP